MILASSLRTRHCSSLASLIHLHSGLRVAFDSRVTLRTLYRNIAGGCGWRHKRTHTRAYYGCVSRDGSVPRWADVIVTNGAKVGVLVAGTAGTAALAMPVVGCSGSGACSGSGGGVCSLPLPCVSTGGDTMVNQ